MVFDAYARYYDLLYRDKDYAAESEYVASYIRTQARSAKRILELGCCGTGAHAAHLARIGFTVHGVDLSDVMLARAEARKATLPAKEAERLTFASGDVRTVQTGATYDAVISLFHVMCYQTTNADLEAAFVTAALHLALAAGIGPGDEVIIPVFTFVATANAVTYTGAVPVLADIDADTLCLDPERVRQAVTPRTKAIIPVHIFGHPADMHAIEEIGREHGLLVIEDAAEAHGAEIGKRRVGSFGLCAAFSFYGNKIITCGEGGMITTNEEFYLRSRHLPDHAMSECRRYWHDAVGFNYRMTNLQAALGVAQLGRIDEILAKKQKIFELYRQGLKRHPCGVVNQTATWAKNVYWMVCFRIPGMTDEKRTDIMERLKDFGIDSRPFFYPLSDMPMYADLPADTPVAHRIHNEGLCLPSYFDLTEEDVT